MRLLGSHISIAGGLHKAFAIGEKIGCTTIQIFTRNANRWKAKPVAEQEVRLFQDAWKTSAPIGSIAHE